MTPHAALTILHIVATLVTAAMLLSDFGHPIVRACAALYLVCEAWLEAYQS